MFNLQAKIKGPGSAEEAGNMKGDDVIVHTQPFLIVSSPPPPPLLADGGVCFLSESTERRRKTKQQKGARGGRRHADETDVYRRARSITARRIQVRFCFHWNAKVQLKESFRLTLTVKARGRCSAEKTPLLPAEEFSGIVVSFLRERQLLDVRTAEKLQEDTKLDFLNLLSFYQTAICASGPPINF